MMVAPVELVLITRHAVRERNSAGQAAFRQQLKRAVKRGKADLAIFLAHQAEKLVGGEMITGFKKGAEDGIALVSMLQPHSLQVLVKDFLRFAHGFARRRRMIVNPSLQHVVSGSPNRPNENEIHFHYTLGPQGAIVASRLLPLNNGLSARMSSLGR